MIQSHPIHATDLGASNFLQLQADSYCMAGISRKTADDKQQQLSANSVRRGVTSA
jgi:hypothetical protein